MQTLYFTHTIILGCIIATSLYMGWLFTETPHRLADKHPILDRKPFNCKPSLTFHFGWIQSALAALLIQSWAFVAAGVTISLITWLILEMENESKIDK